MSTSQETPGSGGAEGRSAAGSWARAAAGRMRAGARGLRVPRAVAIEAGLVVAGSLALVAVLTWPLLLHFGTELPGGENGGDRSGYAWDVWFNAEHGLRLWGSTTQEVVSAPFGRLMPASANVLQITFLGPAWLVGQFAGPVAALNVSLLIGMTLTPAAMYLLIRWLGLGIGPAVWAAGAFALFPNFLLRATGHYPLAFLACMPIVLLALWRWMERPCRRRAIWLAVAVAFCWMTNPYYGTMGLVAAAVGVGVATVTGARASGIGAAARRAGEVAAAVAVIVFVPLALLFWSSRDAVESTFERSRVELDLYGARVTDYLLPDGQQWFFGDLFGKADWASAGAPGGERSNFLGYLTIALAIVGLVAAVRGWRTASPRIRAASATAVPLLLILGWFSLATPTRWLGVTIPTPSDYIFGLAPFLRVYARFAVSVTAVLIVLAALGLAALLRNRRALVAGAVVAVALAVSAVELPPDGGFPLGDARPLMVNGQTPGDVPTWTWLRDNAPRDAVVMEYPGAANELLDRFHMYGQTVHGLAIVNGDPVARGIGSDLAVTLPNPQVPGAAARLAALGVDYAVVNPWLWSIIGLPAPADVGTVPPGFRELRRFSDGSAVWAVTAAPAAAVPIFQRSTWWAPERIAGRDWRYMKDRSAVWVWAPKAGEYEITFSARSHPESLVRTLEVELPDGGTERVEVGPTREVRVRAVLELGRNDFHVVNAGAPAELISPEDGRIVSLQVSDWAVTRPGPDGGTGAGAGID